MFMEGGWRLLKYDVRRKLPNISKFWYMTNFFRKKGKTPVLLPPSLIIKVTKDHASRAGFYCLFAL